VEADYYYVAYLSNVLRACTVSDGVWIVHMIGHGMEWNKYWVGGISIMGNGYMKKYRRHVCRYVCGIEKNERSYNIMREGQKQASKSIYNEVNHIKKSHPAKRQQQEKNRPYNHTYITKNN